MSTLQRLYMVFLAIAIAAIGMASFLLRWGVQEPQKRKVADAKTAVEKLSTETEAETAAKKAKAAALDAFMKKPPMLDVHETVALSGGVGVRPESGVAASKNTLENYMELALSIVAPMEKREEAIGVLVEAASGGNPETIPLLRTIALAKLPPGIPWSAQQKEREMRARAIQGLLEFPEESSYAEDRKTALADLEARLSDASLRERLKRKKEEAPVAPPSEEESEL